MQEAYGCKSSGGDEGRRAESGDSPPQRSGRWKVVAAWTRVWKVGSLGNPVVWVTNVEV